MDTFEYELLSAHYTTIDIHWSIPAEYICHYISVGFEQLEMSLKAIANDETNVAMNRFRRKYNFFCVDGYSKLCFQKYFHE